MSVPFESVHMEIAAGTAAKWWSGVLRSGAKQRLTPLTEEQLQVFETCLRNRMLAAFRGEVHAAEVGRPEYWRPGVARARIACDYCPSPILADAADAAGILSEGYFPIKTSMRIDSEWMVEVSYGHGAPWVTVTPWVMVGPETPQAEP